ncbi:hypothetical protein KY289_008225 [Solanum tuberosum]|nr:hypothetical protein KY289_008225 [Solanum tuberosum]
MPTFFDVMVHLAIHLANEAKLGGPVQFRWMYYIEREHLEILAKENNRNVAKRHKEELPLWFEKKVIELKENGDNRITEELLILARPPDPRVFCYSGYILNDSRFRTMESELGLKTQNNVIRVRPRNLYDLPEQKDEMEPYQLIDLVERGETNQEVELENDNIRIEREDIDGVSVEAPSLNNEEEVDLVVVDEPDHENVDDFSDSATDEDTSEYDEPIMMQNMHISSDTETADVGTIPPPKKKRKGRGKTTGLSTQKKRKGNDNGKLKVIIPSDRTVPVDPGAKDFITELSVKVLHNARHDVKNWKGVPDLAKNRIVAYMLDTFQLTDIQHNRDTILQTTKNLYRYRRSRHHDHFKKFATKEESLQNIPTDVNEAEWKFLVDYSSYDDFKKMSERNKNNKAKQEVNHICSKKTFQAVSYEARDTNTGKEPNFQKLWEITHMKPNGQWVTHAAAEVNDKVKDVVVEKIQEIEEGTDVDPIINAAFVQIMGEKLKYILGQGSGIKSASRISRNEIQEQF